MRYAIDGSVKLKSDRVFDVVIIGAGIAGLYTALNTDPHCRCCILAKENIDISNSWLAQGGIAAAISADDDPRLHFEDTIVAGAGLCDEEAVDVLVREGPGDVKRLVEMKVPFDLNQYGDLQITREGGHHKNRIVHAGGDATGRETVKALAYLASQKKNITFMPNTLFIDIVTKDNSVTGLICKTEDGYELISAKNIVIATGGIGQVYKKSTNPSIATGDGLAAALRSGAQIRDIEFIQFHPTGLWSPTSEDRSFLISEAVRGEGGLLKNKDGVRFMLGTHELNELAPRDIVARAIERELAASGEDHVFVDITAKDREFLEHRFPTIFNECLKRGIDISKEWIPVCPVQHYLIGGIRTDLHARTAVNGLYACGEAASTGVHGANRLASNSMLECLVFGRRAAEQINASVHIGVYEEAELPKIPERKHVRLDYKSMRRELQQLMNDYCRVIRNEAGLTYALGLVTAIRDKLENVFEDNKEYFEMLNLAALAVEIAEAALARKESVGAHYREN
ncbi:MAG: L-aspartate oxidase [Oscillospiraceae bacterium]|nr:L-aspartate oxidase [Oscillospiraceae bacterium]